MKVLFVDFDGVMNNAVFNCQNDELDQTRDDGLVDTGFGTEAFDTKSVDALNLVLHSCDVKVVVSSDRRHHFTIEHLRNTFLHNLVHGEIIDVTPIHRDSAISEDWAIKLRNIEINQWLTAHPEVTEFAVIDDMDLGKHGMTNFVKVSFMVGLTEKDAIQVIKIFNEFK